MRAVEPLDETDPNGYTRSTSSSSKPSITSIWFRTSPVCRRPPASPKLAGRRRGCNIRRIATTWTPLPTGLPPALSVLIHGAKLLEHGTHGMVAARQRRHLAPHPRRGHDHGMTRLQDCRLQPSDDGLMSRSMRCACSPGLAS